MKLEIESNDEASLKALENIAKLLYITASVTRIDEPKEESFRDNMIFGRDIKNLSKEDFEKYFGQRNINTAVGNEPKKKHEWNDLPTGLKCDTCGASLTKETPYYSECPGKKDEPGKLTCDELISRTKCNNGDLLLYSSPWEGGVHCLPIQHNLRPFSSSIPIAILRPEFEAESMEDLVGKCGKSGASFNTQVKFKIIARA